MKKTLVFGASPNPERYAYKAVQALLQKGFEAVPVGQKNGEIAQHPILQGHPDIEDVDTVTLYLGEARQKEHYDYILGLKPKRIIFNPGAENLELLALAKEKGIETVEGCTLVMLSIGNY